MAELSTKAARREARSLRRSLPMTGEALGLYRLLVDRGHAELDTAAIVKVYEGGD